MSCICMWFSFCGVQGLGNEMIFKMSVITSVIYCGMYIISHVIKTGLSVVGLRNYNPQE